MKTYEELKQTIIQLLPVHYRDEKGKLRPNVDALVSAIAIALHSEQTALESRLKELEIQLTINK